MEWQSWKTWLCQMKNVYIMWNLQLCLSTTHSNTISQVFQKPPKLSLFLLRLALSVMLLSDTDDKARLEGSTLKSNQTQSSTFSFLDHLALQILLEAEFLALYSSHLFSLCSLSLLYSLFVALILLFPSLFTGAIYTRKKIIQFAKSKPCKEEALSS